MPGSLAGWMAPHLTWDLRTDLLPMDADYQEPAAALPAIRRHVGEDSQQ